MVNFFVLDYDVKKIPHYYLDTHLFSSYSEIVLILDYCHRYYDGIQRFHQTSILARGVPLVSWVRESDKNYLWTCRLVKEVIKEYEYRFGKERRSKRYDKHYEWFCKNLPKNMPRTNKMTLIRISHSSQFFDELTNDPVINSRYLYADLKQFKKGKDKYTRRERPKWLIELREHIKQEKEKMIKMLDKLDPKLIEVYLNFSYYKFGVSYKKGFKNLIHSKLGYADLVDRNDRHHYLAYPILVKLIKIHRSLIRNVKELVEYSKTLKQNERLDILYGKLIPLLS